jgi:hypothetical protein
LLQLDVIEVVADHHFENNKQLAVADIAVVVDVVDLKRESQFFFLASTR